VQSALAATVTARSIEHPLSRNKMKPIHQMILGAVTAGLSAMIVIPQYSYYTSRAQTSGMLTTLSSIKVEMHEIVETTGSLRGVGSALKGKIPFERPPDFFEISTDGVFIVRGGDDGQLLVLLPRVIDKRIDWTCIGGSRDAMPWDCHGNRVDIGSARNVEINGVVPRPAP
jgi:hypothetical protein